MMNLMAYHGHTPTCETEQTSERVHDFELGLHIAALFAILLTSTFGIDHANSPSEI
jgi:tetrahydromethanopterin S-methyltransferase subunit B